MVAAKGGALLNAIVFAILTALGAVGNTIGPTLLFQIVKAGVIVRKLFVEIPKGIAQFLGDALFGFHSGEIVSKGLRVVKGYLPL